jgi:hypothetical protein
MITLISQSNLTNFNKSRGVRTNFKPIIIIIIIIIYNTMPTNSEVVVEIIGVLVWAGHNVWTCDASSKVHRALGGLKALIGTVYLGTR